MNQGVAKKPQVPQAQVPQAQVQIQAQQQALTIKKINNQKKTYVSPYSQKAIFQIK